MKEREKTVDILDRLFWTVQPPAGLVKGDYYQAENWFAPHYNGDEGYRGLLQVVTNGGRIAMVEFNEINSGSYYIRKWQNVSKRRSGYGFMQATKARTAATGVVLVNGITHLEEQMVAENRLSGSFDLLTGASNSLRRSMLPLAEELAGKIGKPSGVLYYGLSQAVQPGVTGRLQLQYAGGRIIDAYYDEIFADTPEEIEDPELKAYYRQSKYHCLEYVSTIGVGFNTFAELLRRHVTATQDLTGLAGLPFSEGAARAAEYNHYIALAEQLKAEMRADGL